ncbi:uncharacterized protein LOC126737477 [Anthonomus grandis grandis]|uniref:uncharacterized protein LOC126737477 n=1 Tax=Anthonomus grandis grandis TaxID=2921223 RepID=UPI00216510F5|nr:uncharacterized protein LOC126737477 [Anthonomus grandis grandis]
MKLGYFFLFIALQAVNTQSQLHCYFCNTEIDGQPCEDPINTAQIQTQRCTDLELVQGTQHSYFTTLWDNFKQSTSMAVRNGTSNVCILMTYKFDHRNVSSRGCEMPTRQVLSQTLDICDYYRQIIPIARITNFNCSVCTDNLCNHANYQSGDGSGSQVVQLSWKLFLGLIFFKVLIV